MAAVKHWLTLLAALPAEGGEWSQETRIDPVFAGWTQVRLVLGNGVTGMRVLIAMFDPDGRPVVVSDLVSLDCGRRQKSAGGRIEPDGRLRATYLLTEDESHTQRELTAEEEKELRQLAEALRARCNPQVVSSSLIPPLSCLI